MRSRAVSCPGPLDDACSSQSRESSSRVRGYGPRRCTSTDCDMRTRCGARVAGRIRTRRIWSSVTERQRPARRLHTRANRRPVFHSRALRTTERTRTSANNLRSVASHPWNGGIRQPSRSGGNRTLRSFAPNERIEAGLALSIFVSPEITAMSRIPGGNCTRTNGSRDRWTAVIQQGQTRRAREWTSGGSWESRRSYWAP
jgi:hypothetical protein